VKLDKKYYTLALVGAGVFLSTMDSSMVNVALPFIMADFGAPLMSTKWVVLAYLLSITVTLLFWGIAADRFGRFTIYFSGICLFIISSVGCSLAPALVVLIVLRFIEGLGAAMMMAAGPTIIRDVFPRSRIGRGLGLVGIATSAGLMSGPVVGGLLITVFSWRTVFLACVPVGIIIMSGVISLMRMQTRATPTGRQRPFDWKGAALWAALITSLVLYGHFLPTLETGWKGAGGAWVVFLILAFYHTEKRRKSNILPLHLFPRRYYHVGVITASLSFASLFGVLVLMPFYLTHIKALGADMVGLVMTSIPLTLFIVSPTAGMLYDRIGSRYLTTLGLAICTTSLLLLAALGEQTPLVFVFMVLALLGMGQSMFLAPNTASLLSRIDDADAGITSGLLATSRNLGMLVGAALSSILLGAWFHYFSAGIELGSYNPALSGDFISALRATMFCLAAVSLLNVLISWRRKR
jgi:EmrB/QacA subfamily drug resistance transporter